MAFTTWYSSNLYIFSILLFLSKLLHSRTDWILVKKQLSKTLWTLCFSLQYKRNTTTNIFKLTLFIFMMWTNISYSNSYKMNYMNMLSLKPGGGRWSASGGAGRRPGMGPPGGPKGSKRAPGGIAPLENNSKLKWTQ